MNAQFIKLIVLVIWLTLVTAISVGVPTKRTQSTDQSSKKSDLKSTTLKNNSVCWIDNLPYNDLAPVPGGGPCEQCICNSTNVVCSMIKCEVKAACKVIQKPKQCCPNYQCDCEYNGQPYNNGAKIDTSDTPCRVCYCKGGEVICTTVVCYQREDCEGKIMPDTCCPKYDHCPPLDLIRKSTHNGISRTAKNNSEESWLMTTDSARTLEPDDLTTDSFNSNDDDVMEPTSLPVRLNLVSDPIPNQIDKKPENTSHNSIKTNLGASSTIYFANQKKNAHTFTVSQSNGSMQDPHIEQRVRVSTNNFNNTDSTTTGGAIKSNLIQVSTIGYQYSDSTPRINMSTKIKIPQGSSTDVVILSTIEDIQETNTNSSSSNLSSMVMSPALDDNAEVTTIQIKFLHQNKTHVKEIFKLLPHSTTFTTAGKEKNASTAGVTDNFIKRNNVNIETTIAVSANSLKNTITDHTTMSPTSTSSVFQRIVLNQTNNFSDFSIIRFRLFNFSSPENKSTDGTSTLSPLNEIPTLSNLIDRPTKSKVEEASITSTEYQIPPFTLSQITTEPSQGSLSSVDSATLSKTAFVTNNNVKFNTTNDTSSGSTSTVTEYSPSSTNHITNSSSSSGTITQFLDVAASSTTKPTIADIGNTTTVAFKDPSPPINFSMINFTSIFHRPTFDHSNWTFSFANLSDGQHYTELYSQKFVDNPVRFINTVNSVQLSATLGSARNRSSISNTTNRTIAPTSRTSITPTISFTTGSSTPANTMITKNSKTASPSSTSYKILLDGKVKPMTRPPNSTMAPLAWLKGSFITSVNTSAINSNTFSIPLTNVTTESSTLPLKTEFHQESAEAKVYDPLMPYPEEYPEEYQTIQKGPAIIITRTTYTRIPNVTYTTVTMATLPTYKQVQKAEEGFASTLFEGKNFRDTNFTKMTTTYINKTKKRYG